MTGLSTVFISKQLLLLFHLQLGGGAQPFDDDALTAYCKGARLCGWRWTTARTGSTVKDAVEKLVEVIFERTGSLDMIDHSKVRQNFFFILSYD